MTSQQLAQAVVALIKHPTQDLYAGVSRRDDPNAWGLPGGKVDPGESNLEAIIREVKEETGLILISATPDFARTSDTGRYYVQGFRATAIGELRKSEEGEVAWITKEQLCAGPFGEYNASYFAYIKASYPASSC